MKTFVVSLVATLLSSSILSAQERPNFSGVWRMDPSRSESAMQGEPIDTVTVEIEQTPSLITIRTSSRRGVSTETYRLDATLEPSTPGSGRARWVRDELVIDAVRDVRGMSVTIQQSRRMTADGSEMHVDSVLEVQHGYTLAKTKNYGAGRDVYVRVQ